MGKPIVKVVMFDEWEALYIDGKKVLEDHSIDDAPRLLRLVKNLGPFDVESCYYPDYRDEKGNLITLPIDDHAPYLEADLPEGCRE